MARSILDSLLLFALPFVLYAAALLAQRRYPFLQLHWPRGRLALLTIAGLALVVLGLVFFGLLAPRRQGAYHPAHIEGGRLVPGEIE
jgi:hypothetical protein